MKPLPWSHTSLDDFVNCPLAYYEKRVAKSVIETRSDQMIWGEEVHKHFELRIAEDKPLPQDVAAHEPYMRRLLALPGPRGLAEQKIALNTRLQPCGFFDADVWYRGVIDFMHVASDQTATVVDYKTGKPHSKFKQLKLFALWVFAQYPAIKTVKVRYYWTQTFNETGEIYQRSQIRALWQEFMPDLKQYAQAFREDIWQPRQSGLCYGWCPVVDCEFWKPKKRR